MPNTSPEVDRYIRNAAPYAQPILEKIRKVFHKACPEVEETIKWGVPFFDYKGPLGSMAAFKNHVSWGFWKGKLMDDPHGIMPEDGNLSMGGTRIADVKAMPSEKVMLEYIRQAMKLNDDGVKSPARAKRAPGPVEAPDDLMAALKKNKKALATYEQFPPGQKREYVEWITEAKQEATRRKRLATAVEWMSEGKPRNWKYMK